MTLYLENEIATSLVCDKTLAMTIFPDPRFHGGDKKKVICGHNKL
jgi:hypothetical protein